MSRFLKVLSLVLALASFGILAMSCGSGGNAQVRVINAIDQTSQLSLDVYINGTKYFPSVVSDGGAASVYPTPTTPASYVSVPSGNHSVQAFDAGQTTNPVISTAQSLNGSSQYTMLLAGSLSGNPIPIAIFFGDNNTVPTTGNMEVRVINASTYSASAGGIAYGIYQQGSTPPTTPTTLPFEQASSYLVFPFEAGVPYFIQISLPGSVSNEFTTSFTPGGTASAGSVTTIVIMDNPGGGSINSNPLILSDLN
jgi:hypothetical protein